MLLQLQPPGAGICSQSQTTSSESGSRGSSVNSSSICRVTAAAAIIMHVSVVHTVWTTKVGCEPRNRPYHLQIMFLTVLISGDSPLPATASLWLVTETSPLL